MIMAASDNLGGQFGGRTPQEIPAHHRNAILNAIQSMGEQGMELVPGGLHVTPDDGGKSHFIPHNDSHLYVDPKTGYVGMGSRLPSESIAVSHDIQLDDVLGDSTMTSIFWGPKSYLASAMRESHDDPTTLWEGSHDQPLSDRGMDTAMRATRDYPRSYHTGEKSHSIDSPEVLDRLPHIGGNPKTPAQHLTIPHDSRGLRSEDIDALKGLHRSYSHVYPVGKPPLVYPADLTDGPVRSRDRHTIPVTISEDDDAHSYNYNTSNGQITRR